MQKIPIAAIIVEDRQRTELSAIEDLAQSLSLRGQINPIVVMPRPNGFFRLVAGERRLRAAQHLGWTSISATLWADLSPSEAQLIELEENTKRADLSWQDTARAVAKIEELLRAQDPSATIAEVATRAGMSESSVFRNLALASALASDPAGHIAEAETQTAAMNILQRQVARETDRQLEELFSSPLPADSSTEEVSQPQPTHLAAPIFQADFLEWAATYSGSRFNLIHCDFPYGIDHQKSAQGNAAGSNLATYSDTKEIFFTLLSCLLEHQDRFVSESAHMVFWFSMKYYTQILPLLTSAGWKVNPTPLIWYKSDGTGILPDPQRGPRQVYETALLCSRGDRKIVRAVANVAAFPGSKDSAIHLSEKSRPMLNHFLSMLVDSSTRMLDPTCGSGNALICGQTLGASAVLGLEKDPDFASAAADSFLSHTKALS